MDYGHRSIFTYDSLSFKYTYHEKIFSSWRKCWPSYFIILCETLYRRIEASCLWWRIGDMFRSDRCFVPVAQASQRNFVKIASIHNFKTLYVRPTSNNFSRAVHDATSCWSLSISSSTQRSFCFPLSETRYPNYSFKLMERYDTLIPSESISVDALVFVTYAPASLQCLKNSWGNFTASATESGTFHWLAQHDSWTSQIHRLTRRLL